MKAPRVKRILLLADAAYGERMSSPGIRAHHMARVLSERVVGGAVTLAVPGGQAQGEIKDPACRVVHYYTPLSILREMASHDVIVATGFPLAALFLFPWKTFVLDFFTQYYLEWLEATADDPEFSARRRRVWLSQARKLLNIQLTFADFVLAASDRQRDAHIGAMMSLGLIGPHTHTGDPSLRKLIDVAPHGLRPDALEHTKQVVKGRYAGVRETDKLIIWNGGILSWYDPATLIHAFHEVARERNDVKLLFVGGGYPGLGSFGLGKRFREVVDLTRDLGLYNSSVFFDMGWVPYEDIKNYTLEADLSVCTYFGGLETNFSLRTRFLDIFWAEVPLICTRGDVLAQLVDERGLGITVDERDVAGLAAALRRLLDDRDFYEQCKQNIRTIKACLSWEVTLDPLVRFLNEGESIAKPKGDRFLPLIARVVGHQLTKRVAAAASRLGV